MRLIGNIIWVVFGGLLISLGYLFGGLILCLTIVGIPFGVQIMRLGMFALWPFGGEVKPTDNVMGCLPVLMNVLWIIFGGIEVALTHLTLGVAVRRLAWQSPKVSEISGTLPRRFAPRNDTLLYTKETEPWKLIRESLLSSCRAQVF